ncbi:DUF7619 domain-containing protein [Neolewinella antarctica]|uniref:Sugar lactone lactonase YvrE n=1 Tax=Neolewinella antarctica TaxID=442734 RepID=A0ABX0X7R5_9BACT|nr:T9SS type A sorting domain-containing protein [Neolewinella antarctica]NJC25269.1 sugar lactone lactonase YvrE [Neolewinella antarctica]
MKHFLLSFLLLSTLSLTAQDISRLENYLVGTRITYLTGQCGEEVPEAAGRLSFCDAKGNLGIVTHSLGLNGRGVLQMLPNNYNDSEVYVTRGGISIRHVDGSWENVPNVAAEVIYDDDPPSNDGTIETGVVAKNGLIYFTVRTRRRRIVNTYDLITKQITSVPMPRTGGMNLLAYDEEDDAVFALLSEFRNVDLYRLSPTGSELVNNLDDLPGTLSVSINTNKFSARGDSLYFSGPRGLYAINKDNYGNTLYDNSTTGRLPFDRVNDFEFAADGTLWMAQGDRNNGALVRYDRAMNSYDEFEIVVPEQNNPLIVTRFDDLAILNDGRISAVASNFSAIIDLDVSGPQPVWSYIDMDSTNALATPITYRPNQVVRHAGAIYYLTNDFSTGNNGNNEVLIRRNDGSWDTRNDNRPTNISYHDVERFQYFVPTLQGGMYLYSADDDIISYVGPDGNLRSSQHRNIPYRTPTVDQEGRLAFAAASGSTPNYQLLDYPFVRSIGKVRYGNNLTAAYGNVVAFFERTKGVYTRTVNGSVVALDTLPDPTSYADYYHFGVDSKGVAWLASQDRGQGMEFVRYDPATGAADRFSPSLKVGSPTKVISAPDEHVYFIGNRGVILYDGTSFHGISNTDDARLQSVADAVVDTEGRLWIMTGQGDRIHRITNFATNPTFSTDTLKQILPLITVSGGASMALDHKGDIWIEGVTSVWKITDQLTEPFFRPAGGGRTLSGRVYVDTNGNGTVEEDETVYNQVVAVFTNGRVRQTTTDREGRYVFLLDGESGDYRITLPVLGRAYGADIRQQTVTVDNTDGDVAGPDFALFIKNYSSLFFQTANRSGMWGFDRDGFENSFTTAVTNLSTTDAFRDLEIDFSYYNLQPGTGNTLPEVKKVTVTRLTPNGATTLVDEIRIDPQTHRWSLPDVKPTAYVREDLNLLPEIREVEDTVTTSMIVDRLEARQTLIIKIETDLYAASRTGTTIGYGPRRTDSPDFNPNDDPNLSNGPYFFYPSETDNLPPGDFYDDPNSPYVDPSDIYEPAPYLDPADVYGPSPYLSPVRSSYDPNDKLVDGGLASGVNDTGLATNWFTYTIRFENSGNFSAKDVYVVDTIDGLLEPSSLNLLDASHDVAVDYKLSNDSVTVLRFNFEDIYLPFVDSLNDGYVRFALRSKDVKAIGDTITNQAAIYFDQNPAIITNVVRNRFIEIISDVRELSPGQIDLSVFPNPAFESVNIRSEHRILDVDLLDVRGQLISKNGATSVLSVGHLPSGVYLLRVTTDRGVGTRKLILR